MSLNAPSIGVTTSTPVTFSGTIIDNSPGTTQTAQAANFPNGVPVVSDASMARFMEYVYMQQPMPTNTTGVPVSFSVLDANGNLRNIGSTISDANGGFSFTWTPDITVAYTVYASFAGSESYYATSVQAYLNAASPSSSASPGGTTGTSTSTTADLYFVPAMVGVIIILIIILALLAVLLRRR
jgi:hypothetical protein